MQTKMQTRVNFRHVLKRLDVIPTRVPTIEKLRQFRTTVVAPGTHYEPLTVLGFHRTKVAAFNAAANLFRIENPVRTSDTVLCLSNEVVSSHIGATVDEAPLPERRPSTVRLEVVPPTAAEDVMNAHERIEFDL